MPQPIPLSRPDLTDREIDAVVDVLHGYTLSIGPRVEQFERHCAKIVGRRHGVAVSSGIIRGLLERDWMQPQTPATRPAPSPS